MSWRTLLPLLLTGCQFITASEHAERLVETGDTDETGETGDTADTGDTAETGETADTGDDYPSGSYAGTLTLTVDGSLSPTDTCTGDLFLSLQPDTLSGSFACAFDGSLGVYADQAGRVEGTDAAGDLVFTTDFDTTVAWTGTLGGNPPTIHADFHAEDVAWGVDHLTLDGYFSAAKE